MGPKMILHTHICFLFEIATGTFSIAPHNFILSREFICEVFAHLITQESFLTECFFGCPRALFTILSGSLFLLTRAREPGPWKNAQVPLHNFFLIAQQGELLCEKFCFRVTPRFTEKSLGINCAVPTVSTVISKLHRTSVTQGLLAGFFCVIHVPPNGTSANA